MTDLERADALLYALLTEDDAPQQEAMLARVLAAARREGQEVAFREGMEHAGRIDKAMLANAERVGAEEMRERAARALDEDAPWAAAAIRALPLPEELA